MLMETYPLDGTRERILFSTPCDGVPRAQRLRFPLPPPPSPAENPDLSKVPSSEPGKGQDCHTFTRFVSSCSIQTSTLCPGISLFYFLPLRLRQLYFLPVPLRMQSDTCHNPEIQSSTRDVIIIAQIRLRKSRM